MQAGGGYKKIYVWDPDEVNLKQLRKNIRKYDNVVCIPCGMWSKQDELRFNSTGGGDSSITEDNAADLQTIKVDSIDNVCAGDKVTFIKMDIEGSEQEALRGAVNVIRRDKPRLAICVYHKFEDLYEIPFWIKQTVPEYKIYMRHHSDEVAETVVYATL